MADIQLFKFSNLPTEIKKARVTTDDENHATRYEDEKVALGAYIKMRERFKDWLLAENLIVLTGAGSSITTDGEGKSLDEGNKKHTGKSVSHVWEAAKKDLDQKVLTKLYATLGEADDTTFNLERFISKLETYKAANGNDEDSAMKQTVAECETVKNKIITKIKDECKLILHQKAPHETFLRNIMTVRKRQQSRLQLFTLNYDTLFEQAAEILNATIIDGFSFTRTPIFNAANFELDIVRRGKHRVHHEENYEEKVFNLYKLHGSLEWENADGKTVRRQDTVSSPLIIPPSFNKFEQSYQMPFFEMMSRFQQAIRKENTTLMIIGYSFGDEHVNRVISEALSSNFNLEVVIISPSITAGGDIETIKNIHGRIDAGQNNITLVSDTFQRFTANMPSVSYVDSEDTKTSEANEGEVRNGSDQVPF